MGRQKSPLETKKALIEKFKDQKNKMQEEQKTALLSELRLIIDPKAIEWHDKVRGGNLRE